MLPYKNVRKKTRMLTLFIITIGLSLSTFNLFTLKSSSLNSKMDDKSNLDDFQDSILKISSYPQTFENSGDDINITLHQSYVNSSFNTIVNTSIVNGNNFTLPCPKDVNFNSTFTNITVNNIFAPNKSLDVEINAAFPQILSFPFYTSFEVLTNCYLNAVDVNINAPATGSIFTYDVFSAKFASSYIRPDIDLTGGGSNLGTIANDSNTDIWLKLVGLNQLLNVSETYNNTFFISISASDIFSSMWNADNTGDDTISYNNPSGNPLNVDLTLKVDLAPLNNTPKPSDIGLKINNLPLNDINNGSGFWESTLINSSATGLLKYNTSADWWDVKCNITQVQINYTKTHLKASSNFEIYGSGQNVKWNVTRNGGLDYFDTNFNNYTINFTIPITWNKINVFNGSTNKTDSISSYSWDNGYTDIKIPNAGNGTYWFLNATSTNLISSIDTYVGGIAIDDIANYTNTVRFNVTFSEIIMNGSLNLSVYSPIPNYLNHSQIINLYPLASDTEFNITDWDLSLNVTKYGVFITRMAWNNGTAAGFLIGNLTILGDTELTFDPLPSTFDASDIFNITAFFNDTGYIGQPPKNISDAIISYRFNNGNFRTTNITNLGDGEYNITIDCNDTDFIDYGQNSITINASRQYYNNQSETVNITIIGKTALTIINPTVGTNFDSLDTFNITIKYNNTLRDELIANPTINYSLDDGITYRWKNVTDIGNNQYNISINCNDVNFTNYGSFDIIINASKSYYYNQSETLNNIKITGNTSLTFTKWPDKAFYYSDETFNITAYFNDTARNQGIIGANIEIDVEGSPYISSINVTRIKDLGDGNYNITIDCNDSQFIGYGNKNIKINASKQYYYDYINSSLEMIIGNTSLSIPSPSDNSVFKNSQNFNITIQYYDVAKNSGIVDAEINYTLNGGINRYSNITYIGQGKYNISIDGNNTDFSSNGPNTIVINASKQYYNNLSKTINIIIWAETNLTILSPLNGINFDSSNTFNITVKYNNSIRSEIITAPNINYSLNGGLDWRYDNIESIGDNKYNITVNCNDIVFGNYGPKTIIVNASKTEYYYNQSKSLNITITGNTSLTLSKWIDKPSYYSDEMFNITVNFKDTSRNQGIDGATIDIDVDGTTYISSSLIYIGNGNYNITINCSDVIFSNYGLFTIRVNASRLNYYTKSNSSIKPSIIGNTSLIILGPSNLSEYKSNQIFNITIQYTDIVKADGVAGAMINYSLNGGLNWRFDNYMYIGNGQYNITIDCNDAQFGLTYGYIDLIVNVSKQYYNNLSNIITINRIVTTTITSSQSNNLGSVIRGLSLTYTLNYSDTDLNPIKQASWELVSSSFNFISSLENKGFGEYTMHLDSSSVNVGSYDFIFSISAMGNETQIITLTITVTSTTTGISNIASIGIIARHTGANQTVTFSFIDTIKSQGISSLTTANIKVYDETGEDSTLWQRGTQDHNWTLINLGDGNYELRISTSGLSVDTYALKFQIINLANYVNAESQEISFYLRGYYSTFGLILLTDDGGQLFSNDSSYNYSSYVKNDLNIRFNLTNTDLGSLVLEHMDTYYFTYINLNNSVMGTIDNNIEYNSVNDTYGYFIGTLNLNLANLTTGYYQFNILITKTNFENVTFSFYLTIQDRYDVNIFVYSIPDELNAGESFKIAFNISIILNSPTQPLIGATVRIIPIINGEFSTSIFNITNGQGIVSFDITLPSNTRNFSLLISLDGVYNFNQASLELAELSVNPPKTTGIPFETILLYLIITGIAIGVSVSSLGVYKGVIVPKKRTKARVLAEVKTLFDDAINLEHILIIYKGTGTCVFFKSFGSEKIDPELISGFISAICSFGKDLVWQEELNEISYGEKMLLLTDGEHIRVALVLGKKASLILRKNLKEFIRIFEETYANELPNWRGQLDIFRSAGTIIDEMLNTSIILPHEITYEFSSMKALKKPHSREMLKIAEQMMKDAERNFFFIATLLKEATEKTSKDTAEIFMGIKELRDQKILMPIEIATIEAPTISQQELNLIEQKVSTLVNILPAEKQKLVNDLAQLGPAEREAYFSSITEQQEVVSAPIESPPEVIVVENVKNAKKQIKILRKKASSAKKEKDYDGCIRIYQNAANLATEWDLHNELYELDEIIRKTKIEDLRIKMKALEKDAKEAAKVEDYNEASQKFRIASKVASEIFKLGGTEMTKEVKRLSNKSKEYEKLI